MSKKLLARVREVQEERRESLLRIRQVLARTGLKRSSLYTLIKRGQFPPPLKLGDGERARAVAWQESRVDAWIAARVRAHEEAVA